jgi:hypothetical protein
VLQWRRIAERDGGRRVAPEINATVRCLRRKPESVFGDAVDGRESLAKEAPVENLANPRNFWYLIEMEISISPDSTSRRA